EEGHEASPVGGHVVRVSDHDDGYAIRSGQPHAQRHDLAPAGTVLAYRGLVGKYDLRIAGERAGDGDALLLAAGKLRRVVMLAALQPDLGQRLGGAGGAFGAAHALVDQRKLDVFLCRGAREEVEALEDEAEV